MKRLVLLLLVFVAALGFSAGLEISERIKVVILPAEVSQSWLKGDVDYLLSMLEEAMTDLGRFEVYSRAHVKEIMKERGLAEMGITDVQAEELGKLAGAQYVILLKLDDLRTGYRNGKYWASARLSIRLLDISDGRIVASKPIDRNTGSYYRTSEEAKEVLFESIKYDFLQTIKEFFKLKAVIVKVEGGKAYLSGVNPELLKVGMIFEVKGGLGKVGYVKLVGEENGYVVAEVLYGDVKAGLEAKEVPMMGGGGALILSYYSDFKYGDIVPLFGIGFAGWRNLYAEAAYVLGGVLSYVPFDVALGMRFEVFRFGRIFVGVHGGADIFGIYDIDNEDIIGMLFGATAGIDLRYEFDPKSGVFAKIDYKYLAGMGGTKVFSAGYFAGF